MNGYSFTPHWFELLYVYVSLQVSPGLEANQVIQVLVFKVTLDVWDHLAHQAHMDLEVMK